MVEIENELSLNDLSLARSLFGPNNSHLRLIEKMVGPKINVRGQRVRVSGDPPQVALVIQVLKELYGLLAEKYPLYSQDIEFAVRILSQDEKAKLKHIFLDRVFINSRKRTITPKSLAQKQYIEAIRKHDIVFGIGPAGTGKTYLAMAMAVAALTAEKVRRIVLARPAVEAGEKLGFLPGDLAEKRSTLIYALSTTLFMI